MSESIRTQLASAQDLAKKFLDVNGHKPKVFAAKNLIEFFRNIPVVLKLIFREPEILLLVGIQWIVICLAYLAWLQMLQWIPDQVWNAIDLASKQDRKVVYNFLNIALLLWSFFIVYVASYPIAICNAAMVAVHDLYTSKKEISIYACFVIATQHVGRIWQFTAIDAWITVRAILDRLPKKHRNRSAADELLYYAWKVATIVVVPSLVNGRNFIQAGKDSLQLLSAEPLRAIGLRFGYSAVCWIIGILAYLAAIIYFAYFGSDEHQSHWLYNFYFLMTGPIFVAVGIVTVLLRPFYLLGVAKFYTDSIDVSAEIEKDLRTPHHGNFLFSKSFIIFLVLLCVLMACVFFPDQLGITTLINRLATKI